MKLWILSGPATINGNEITLIGLGTVVLRAEQAGNEEFMSAAAERHFVVGDAIALTLEATDGTIEATPRVAQYVSGSTVSLRAKAAVGFRFDHWEGDAAGTSNPLTIFLDRNKHVIARFTVAKPGSIDPTFDASNSSYPSAVALATQPDGKILVAVGSSPGTRLNADGSIDPTFSFVANAPVLALALQADGKILLGGTFTEVNGALRAGVARLHPNGALDVGFNPGEGSLTFNFVGIARPEAEPIW